MATPGLPARMLIDRARRWARLWRNRRRLLHSGLFDADWYRAAYLDGRGGDPARDYLEHGAQAGRRPNPLFDSAWYLQEYPDVALAGVNPALHYVLHGGAQGRDPNPYFSSAWYLSAYPDVAEGGANPLAHYLRHGQREGRRPSLKFDPVFYAQFLERDDPGRREPLTHFLTVGEKKGLKPAPLISPTEGERVEAAAITALKPWRPDTGGETALLVTHSPDGRLRPHVGRYAQALRRVGVGVVLVVAADAPFTDLDAAGPVEGLYVRENAGFDFAAWAHLLRLEPRLWDVQRLFLLNDSVLGPIDEGDFQRMMVRLRASAAEIVALTENHERGWNIQSYFLALSAPALKAVQVQRFFQAVRALSDVERVIDLYEVQLGAVAVSAGLRVEVLFRRGAQENPTLFHWRDLLDEGFPFLKTSLATGRFHHVDGEGWRERLASKGYDLALADALDAPRAAPSEAVAPAPAAGPVRNIAFYGPWNYESGLGQASRGYLSALMRLEERVNLHGLKLPFHVHRRLSSGYDVRNFADGADLAIVHLNPDGWHLMTGEQRREMGRARLKVGLWVWEMDQVPDFFFPNILKVDAVWSPSRYCADIFARASGRPAHVVPHVVPVPERRPARPLNRTILYVFDGSSYLARKNPIALVEAFARSGLGPRGWRLVLKTKNLFENEGEGRALADRAREVGGVEIIDAGVSRDALAALFEAADIYASPHTAEGFGLTIAEAMAAGKTVVATDYSGSADFLDASCGFPVAYDLAEAETDHGHYRRGGTWAQVRRDALAEALVLAAERLEAGDHTLGEAARARVAERLSPEAVAATMREGLSKLAHLTPIPLEAA